MGKEITKTMCILTMTAAAAMAANPPRRPPERAARVEHPQPVKVKTEPPRAAEKRAWYERGQHREQFGKATRGEVVPESKRREAPKPQATPEAKRDKWASNTQRDNFNSHARGEVKSTTTPGAGAGRGGNSGRSAPPAAPPPAPRPGR
jgi:hypothetical protein